MPDHLTTNGSLSVCVMVAHPDDETLWAGGTLLINPQWRCRIFTLCRASDTDRAPKFASVLKEYNASGTMADMDDSRDQSPLQDSNVQETVAALIGAAHYDLFITHSPWGEYTSHRRHQEVNRAVISLWQRGILKANKLWFFAYNDKNETHLPLAVETADIRIDLPSTIWEEKYRIICDLYGFLPDSWEARATPRIEAFWSFNSPDELTSKFLVKEVE
ncbi:MAG: PIG-L deacetylase family protein [Armatimonadota bacterium]